MEKIAASILSADFARLGEDVKDVLAAGADYVHFDVMDNHYVPNLTFGPMVLKAIKPMAGDAVVDVHLMIEPVDTGLMDAFIDAGANIVTFHPEATKHVHRTLQHAKSRGVKTGLAINPGTPLSYVENVLDLIDMVLVMSVNPGFGGQSFIPATIDKIRDLRRMLDEYIKGPQSGRSERIESIPIEVDGGVNPDNAPKIAMAGAEIFVMGSALFGKKDYGEVVKMFHANIDAIGDRVARTKVAAFDLDGTLVHSIPDLAASANAMRKELGMGLADDAVLRSYVGDGMAKLVHRALTNDREGAADEALFEKAFKIFKDHYRVHLLDRTRPFPGALEALDALRGKVGLALLTNKNEEFALSILKGLGMLERFDIVLGGDSLSEKKPSRLPLDHIAEKFGVTSSEIMMVGDSHNDMLAARNAGSLGVWLAHGYETLESMRRNHDVAPDIEARNFDELVSIFERYGKKA